MIYMNDKMKNRIKRNDTEIHHTKLIEKIISDTIFFHDCIVYDPNLTRRKMLSRGVDYEGIINSHGGEKTVYEVGCNDIDIDFRDLDASEIETFLLDLNDALVRKFNHKMAIYIYPRVYINDDDVEMEQRIWNLRFHSLWEGEPTWLVSDLNEYDNAVACYLADEKWLTMEFKKKDIPQND